MTKEDRTAQIVNVEPFLGKNIQPEVTVARKADERWHVYYGEHNNPQWVHVIGGPVVRVPLQQFITSSTDPIMTLLAAMDVIQRVFLTSPVKIKGIRLAIGSKIDLMPANDGFRFWLGVAIRG